MMKTVAEDFLRLVDIMHELREKCPWDRKQTIGTLRSMTIEETYELGDAIIEEDWENIKEELGDLLMHIVFYARLAEEQSRFTLDDVIKAVCEKLIVRHPHIYGDIKVNNEEDVKRNWEAIKIREGKSSVMDGVPASLPAIVKATRIQEKAKQVGFEWHDREDVWKKIEEELNELHHEVEKGDRAATEEEFGDVLFSMVNYARFLHIDAETALEKVNKKFLHRFKRMEAAAGAEGKQLSEMTLEEMDAIWNKIKKEKLSS